MSVVDPIRSADGQGRLYITANKKAIHKRTTKKAKQGIDKTREMKSRQAKSRQAKPRHAKTRQGQHKILQDNKRKDEDKVHHG